MNADGPARRPPLRAARTDTGELTVVQQQLDRARRDNEVQRAMIEQLEGDLAEARKANIQLVVMTQHLSVAADELQVQLTDAVHDAQILRRQLVDAQLIEGVRTARAAPRPAAKRSAPPKRPAAKRSATAKRPAAKRSATAKRPAAKRSATAKRPAAKRAAPPKRPAAKRSAPAKRPAATATATAAKRAAASRVKRPKKR
ncbi:MAG: hypothetical protein ABIV94_02705 [Acidimicrobiales bacterium]